MLNQSYGYSKQNILHSELSEKHIVLSQLVIIYTDKKGFNQSWPFNIATPQVLQCYYLFNPSQTCTHTFQCPKPHKLQTKNYCLNLANSKVLFELILTARMLDHDFYTVVRKKNLFPLHNVVHACLCVMKSVHIVLVTKHSITMIRLLQLYTCTLLVNITIAE